ncbi:MAG: tetratricopeptide repeat protein [Candidatus Binataceae bacterium]
MKPRRTLAQMRLAIEHARTRSARASAYYQLALFHDNNAREGEAIPHYELAIRLGLSGESRAQAFAWLASSFHKIGSQRRAMRALRESRSLTRDPKLRKFLAGLEARIARR